MSYQKDYKYFQKSVDVYNKETTTTNKEKVKNIIISTLIAVSLLISISTVIYLYLK